MRWATNARKTEIETYQKAAKNLKCNLETGKPKKLTIKDYVGIYTDIDSISKLFDEYFRVSVSIYCSQFTKITLLSSFENFPKSDVYGLVSLIATIIHPGDQGFESWYVPKGKLRNFHPAPYFIDIDCGYIICFRRSKEEQIKLNQQYDYDDSEEMYYD